jgi:NADH-quinone oxidoreductase subunit E
MAWLFKNSAGAQVERRPEPYLDAALRARIEQELLPRYPTRRAATLPVLHAIQHAHQWIPPQALEEAAEFLGLSATELLDTASFYEEFWLRPRGRHLIMVCRSLSCELAGQRDLLSRVRQRLGIGPGQTTADGRFTVVEAECLGSCGTAPCALVDQTLHELLSVDQLDAALDAVE